MEGIWISTCLLVELRPHLLALVDAALSPPQFDAATSERTLRLGLSDSADQWLLPGLLRVLEKEAPRMARIVLPVQFRNVAAALSTPPGGCCSDRRRRPAEHRQAPGAIYQSARLLVRSAPRSAGQTPDRARLLRASTRDRVLQRRLTRQDREQRADGDAKRPSLNCLTRGTTRHTNAANNARASPRRASRQRLVSPQTALLPRAVRGRATTAPTPGRAHVPNERRAQPR